MTKTQTAEPTYSAQVIIAALNEAPGIGATIAEIKDVLGNIPVLVVDGKSNDYTTQIAKRHGAEVIIQNGEGKGNALSEAFRHVDLDTDYVIITDADYTYPAKYIPVMIRMLEENSQIGMVCGNRFNSHLDKKALHDLFYLGNRMLAWAHNILNGVPLSDPLTGLRVIRTEALHGLHLKSKSFDIEVELNHAVERRGFTIDEIPILYRERLGEKKLKISHGVTILKRILSEAVFPD